MLSNPHDVSSSSGDGINDKYRLSDVGAWCADSADITPYLELNASGNMVWEIKSVALGASTVLTDCSYPRSVRAFTKLLPEDDWKPVTVNGGHVRFLSSRL